MSKLIRGVMPAIVTPFTKGGARVDYDKACALAEWFAQKGVHGIYVCGTTGEGLIMTPGERKKLLEELVAAVGKRIHVLAHTGCLDTATTIELTCHALEAGAEAAGVIAPGYYPYDDAAIIAHYKAVAKAAKGGPVLLYDLPAFARNALSLEAVLELAQVDNIVGMKESHRDLVGFAALADHLPKDFSLINGADEYTFQAYLTGAHGSVSGVANIVPKLFLDIYNSVHKGDTKKARKVQTKLSAVCAAFRYGNTIARFKEAMKCRGLDTGSVRPPQRELTAREKKAIAKSVEELGLGKA